MTTEQKAAAYDRAIKIAKEINNEQRAQPFDVMTRVFPELKESEDERIRKELVAFVKSRLAGFPKCDRFIAWLEKQGKVPVTIDIDKMIEDYSNNNERGNEEFGKPVNCMIRAYRLGITDTLSILNLEKQGVQKSIWHNEDEEPQKDSLILLIMQSGTPIVAKIIEPNHTFNHGERWAYIDDLLEKQGEQKPAEWSEEDEVMINRIVACLENLNVSDNDILLKDVDWLKSIKDRVQPQKESDERNKLLGKLEEWLDEYVSDLADVDTATLIGCFTNYLDGKEDGKI